MGLRIGRGETLEQITGDMTAIAEGVLTARSAHMLAKKLGVQASNLPLLVDLIPGTIPLLVHQILSPSHLGRKLLCDNPTKSSCVSSCYIHLALTH